jgi:integrase/recombinase XerD
MKLHDVIRDYLAHQHSIGRIFTSRRFLLRAFNRAVGREIEIQHVDPNRVLAFLGRPTTRYWHDKYYALACLYRYATSRGLASSVPLPRTIPKISSQFVPYIYTHDDVRRLLEATNSYRKIHIVLEPHTFRAILLLLYGAGLRISEALSLRMDDVDLSQAVLLIRETKFYKSRLVPIGSQLQQAMKKFAETRRGAGHSEMPDAPFFIGRTGDQLTIPTVQQSFRQLRAHAGILRAGGARCQPRLHDLRHAFCVNRLVAAYEAGADVTLLLPKLSTYVGHIDLNSTQRYLTMTPALLQQACGRFERYAMAGGTDA